MGKVRNHWLSILCMGALILIVGVGLGVKYGMERAAAEEVLAKFPDRGVARMNITLNGVTLSEINEGSKDTKYEGNELSLYEGSEVREFGNVQVKGRGNATWNWIPDKKPLRIKFSNKVDLFGLGSSKKWCLLANHMDETNLRNDIALHMGQMLGMKYAYGGEYVELYIDGEYRGLYYVLKPVEISKSAVNLKDPFGILVELDNIYGGENNTFYETRNGDKLVVKDVTVLDNKEEAMKSFLADYNQLEVAIEEKDYDAITDLVDIESVAQYYLLSEFTVNPDAYWTSFYFYKDGMSDKIHFGPAWDYDFALANKGWTNWLGEKFYSPRETMVRKEELKPKEYYDELELGEDSYKSSLNISKLMFNMVEIPEFREEVRRVFQETWSGKKDELMKFIESREELITESAKANEKLWGRDKYVTETAAMVKWIGERFDYFEDTYGGKMDLDLLVTDTGDDMELIDVGLEENE